MLIKISGFAKLQRSRSKMCKFKLNNEYLLWRLGSKNCFCLNRNSVAVKKTNSPPDLWENAEVLNEVTGQL